MVKLVLEINWFIESYIWYMVSVVCSFDCCKMIFCCHFFQNCYLLFMWASVCLSKYEHMRVGAQRPETLVLLKLELDVFVSHLTWEVKLMSPTRVLILNFWDIFLCKNFYFKINFSFILELIREHRLSYIQSYQCIYFPIINIYHSSKTFISTYIKYIKQIIIIFWC